MYRSEEEYEDEEDRIGERGLEHFFDKFKTIPKMMLEKTFFND